MAELTISEAAAALGVSVDTVRRKIKRGELHAEHDARGRYVVMVEGQPPGLETQASGPGEMAGLRLSLEQAQQMVAELRHQRDVLEAELQAMRDAMQDAAKERSEMRILLGNAQMQMRALLPTSELAEPSPAVTRGRPRRWWWPF